MKIGSRFLSAGISGLSSYGATLTAGGSANTKGTAVELLAAASNNIDAVGMYIQLHNVSAAAGKHLVDILIGSSLDQAIIKNIMVQAGGANTQHCGFFIPLALPKSTRLGAANQAATASHTILASAILIGSADGPPPITCSYTDTYGAETGDSTGISLDPGGTVDTWSGWTEFSASLPRACKWAVVLMGDQGNAAPTTARFGLQIGVGANGSEQVVVPELLANTLGTIDSQFPVVWSFPLILPAGARLVARIRSSTNIAGDRTRDVSIILAG